MPRQKQTRQAPPPRWRDRYATATTPDAQLVVSYDRFRAGLAWLRRRQPRNLAAEQADHAAAAEIAAAAAATLTELSERIESRKAATRRERNPAA